MKGGVSGFWKAVNGGGGCGGGGGGGRACGGVGYESLVLGGGIWRLAQRR